MEFVTLKGQCTEFNIMDEIIEFDDSFIFYNTLKNTFSEATDKLLGDIPSEFPNYFGDIDAFSMFFYRQYSSLIQSLTNLSVKLLVSFDILTCNENSFKEEYMDYFMNLNTISAIDTRKKEIESNYTCLIQQREFERNSRSHWEGGGFGLTGAIKGSLQAGALNLVTDGFRSIGDSFTDSSDKKKFNSSLNRLANENSAMGILNDLYDTARGIFTYFMNEIYSNEIIPEQIFDVKTSQIVFENAINHLNDPIKILHIVVQCIQKNPYNFSFLKYLMEYYGDPDGEIYSLAEFLGLKDDFESALRDLAEDVTDEREDSCYEVARKIKKIQEFEIRFDCSMYDEIERLEKLDVEYRTVNGYVCSTQAHAQKLEQTLAMSENNCSTVGLKINKLTECMKEIRIDITPDIRRLHELDAKYRTVNGILYRTIQDADHARNDINTLNVAKESNFNNYTIPELTKLRNLAIQYNHTWVAGNENYIELIDSKISETKIRNSKLEKIISRMSALDKTSLQELDAFEQVFQREFFNSQENSDDSDIATDIKIILKILKTFVNLNTTAQSKLIPQDINSVISNMEKERENIKISSLTQLVADFTPYIKEANARLDVLTSIEYKESYREAYREAYIYSRSLKKVSFFEEVLKETVLTLIICFVLIYLINKFLPNPHGLMWLLSGGIELFLWLGIICAPFSFYMDYSSHKKDLSAAQKYVKDNPSTAQNWAKLTNNGKLLLSDYIEADEIKTET